MLGGQGGPPMMQGAPGGPPPMMQSSEGPPMLGGQGGPPSLGGGGPPSLGGGGPPPLMGKADGPPSLDSGPPMMGGGGPPMMGGPPPAQPKKRKSGAEATGFVDLGGVHRAIRSLKPAYSQYEVARQQFERAVEEALGQIPANTRDTAMAFLRREFPNMPGANVFAAASSDQGAAEASSTVTNFAAHVLNTVRPPANADEQSAFLARIADVLQTTAQAFIEIRNVQARFGEEMGVRTIREFTQLHAAGDARAVLDYLLDWRSGGRERTAQLSGVYSDFMLHQVALINGVVEGVQSLMDQFRPAEIERGVGGLSKSAAAWKKYTERYTEEIEERGISALVFGEEFARAYAEVGQG